MYVFSRSHNRVCGAQETVYMAFVLFMYMFRNLKSLEIEILRLQNELNAHDSDKSKVENLTKQLETTITDHKNLVMHIEDF